MEAPRIQRGSQSLQVHQDAASNDSTDELTESRGPLEDSGCTKSADSDNEDAQPEASVLRDMRRLEESFRGISRKYKLIDRIGEGTFSTVYKAQDLEYYHYRNDWDFEEKENFIGSPSGRKAKRARKEHFVAIKKIYCTSSPQRIMNELELLHDLQSCKSIAPLITAFRNQDQVIAVLPYFRHADFRVYFREMKPEEIRIYFRSLFSALKAVHDSEIIHRDIKPTNFLYNPSYQRGVLVDFGLAEREGTDYQPCICELSPEERKARIGDSWSSHHEIINGIPKHDERPSLRANRAGTRGFRAPEVLFKCTAQSTKIDVWSAGIVLLTILSKRFPFFNSTDDIDAVLELLTIFGKAKMRRAALLHGRILDTNVPTISDRGHSLDTIIIWSLDRPQLQKDGSRTRLKPDEVPMVEFLGRCLELDPNKRISAEEAFDDPFLVLEEDGGSEDEMNVLSGSSQDQS